MNLIKALILLIGTSGTMNLIAKSNDQRNKRYLYDLAICAIFQNEAAYLKEWIEFHKLVGVQHFILYNNFSSDNFKDVLKPYIEKKEVELFDWNIHAHPHNPNWVLSAYNDAIIKSRRKIKWLALLDLDEFLFPVQESNLLNFLKQYEDYGALCVNWAMYGTSNVKKINSYQLLIESLTIRAKDDFKDNLHVKSIIRPDRVKSMPSQHFAIFRRGYYQVNADKITFSGPWSPYVSLDKIRINHYWTRDEDFFFNVKIPRRGKDMGERPEDTIILKNKLNDVQDLAIFKYVPQLIKLMGK